MHSLSLSSEQALIGLNDERYIERSFRILSNFFYLWLEALSAFGSERCRTKTESARTNTTTTEAAETASKRRDETRRPSNLII